MPPSSSIQNKVVSISIFSCAVALRLWPHLWCNQCPSPWFDAGHVKQLAAARSLLFPENLNASEQQVLKLGQEGDGNQKAAERTAAPPAQSP